MSKARVTAFISARAKLQVERYAEAHGNKLGHLIEEALLHHLHALRELAADVLISPRLVLTPKSFARVLELVKRPRKPTRSMRDLRARKPVANEPADW